MLCIKVDEKDIKLQFSCKIHTLQIWKQGRFGEFYEHCATRMQKKKNDHNSNIQIFGTAISKVIK